MKIIRRFVFVILWVLMLVLTPFAMVIYWIITGESLLKHKVFLKIENAILSLIQLDEPKVGLS